MHKTGGVRWEGGGPEELRPLLVNIQKEGVFFRIASLKILQEKNEFSNESKCRMKLLKHKNARIYFITRLL